MPKVSWRARCSIIGQISDAMIGCAILLKDAKVGHYYRVLRCIYVRYGIQYYVLDSPYIVVVTGKTEVRHDLKLEIQMLYQNDGTVKDEVMEVASRDANKLLLPLSEKEIIDFGNQATINAMGKVEKFITRYPKPDARKRRKK